MKYQTVEKEWGLSLDTVMKWAPDNTIKCKKQDREMHILNISDYLRERCGCVHMHAFLLCLYKK